MPPADRTAWERLGKLLADRRAQISPRYANRRAFAADREMNWRTLHDVELAKRDNFRPETMRAFEAAYMLVPGSLDRVLAGGDLEPLPPPALVPPLPAGALAEQVIRADDALIERLIRGDEVLDKIWRLIGPDGRPVDREKRIKMMEVVLADDPPPAQARQGGAG
jgi:AcrR family transcriptional regulator